MSGLRASHLPGLPPTRVGFHPMIHGQLAEKSRDVASMLVETKRMAEGAGLNVEVLSAGGTHNYEIMGAVPGITEVCAGAYALLDSRYAPQRPEAQTSCPDHGHGNQPTDARSGHHRHRSEGGGSRHGPGRFGCRISTQPLNRSAPSMAALRSTMMRLRSCIWATTSGLSHRISGRAQTCTTICTR